MEVESGDFKVRILKIRYYDMRIFSRSNLLDSTLTFMIFKVFYDEFYLILK